MLPKRDVLEEKARDLASRIIGELHGAALSFESGVRSGDEEAIHDCRVLVRRLRVALSNFAACLDPAGRKLMRRELSDLADKLGAVRDLDVFIAALKTRRNKLPAAQQVHLQNYITRLRARRRRRQRQLIEYLNSENYRRIKDEFLMLVEPTVLPDTSVQTLQPGEAAPKEG